MNPNSISHRLFIAALKPADPLPVKRPSAVRSPAANDPTKTNAGKSSPSLSALSALSSRQVANWSWSGWQQNTI